MSILKSIKAWWNRKETKWLQETEAALMALPKDLVPWFDPDCPECPTCYRIPHLSEFTNMFTYEVDLHIYGYHVGWCKYRYRKDSERSEVIKTLAAGCLRTDEPYPETSKVYESSPSSGPAYGVWNNDTTPEPEFCTPMESQLVFYPEQGPFHYDSDHLYTTSSTDNFDGGSFVAGGAEDNW